MTALYPCLWFDGQAEEAARFYASVLPDSHIDEILRSPIDYPGGKVGDVLTVAFTLLGQRYLGLNGGPYQRFSEAISITIECDDQAEVDRYWTALSAHPESEMCGWLKDRYGLSWQIVPKRMLALLRDPDPARARRAMEAMTRMKKIDVTAVERAADDD